MTPDQLARATAALDVWWERDRTPWLTRAWDQRELESMHAALEAPDTDAALEAVGATTGTYLSTPEQDAWNRATMSELRQALLEAESQADAEPGENRPSRHQGPGSESPDRCMSQLRADDAGLTGDPGSWVQPTEVYLIPCLHPRSPDPESVARVEWETGPDEHGPEYDQESVARIQWEAGPDEDGPGLEPW